MCSQEFSSLLTKSTKSASAWLPQKCSLSFLVLLCGCSCGLFQNESFWPLLAVSKLVAWELRSSSRNLGSYHVPIGSSCQPNAVFEVLPSDSRISSSMSENFNWHVGLCLKKISQKDTSVARCRKKMQKGVSSRTSLKH